ncbi:MAG TPA: hypothetical protein VFW11_02500 [Cyclobacteriaceae bacterium]|nr:hypothetical protein [Cyclobacteriaceae bacterium]
MKSLNKIYIGLVMLGITVITHGQNLNSNWNSELTTSLQHFIDCKSKSDENAECAKYIAESLQTVYKVNDFYSSRLGRYLMVAEIAKFLNETNQWTMLGHGYEQKALADAQNNANAKKAVIAVYMNETGSGHVALILPGDLQPSGSWGLNVPNSASFLLMEPQRSYVGKGLSYAFAKNHLKDVVLYARNY